MKGWNDRNSSDDETAFLNYILARIANSQPEVQ
jgi:hypothetical protein